MLGSVQLGSYQLGQGAASAVVEPPDVDVEPDVVHVTAGIQTHVHATARVHTHVRLTAGLKRIVRLRLER